MGLKSNTDSNHNFNVIVGSSTGILKGLNFSNNAPPIIKKFSKGNPKTNELEIASMVWSSEKQEEIVVGFTNKNVSVFDTSYSYFDSSKILDNGPGPLVSVGVIDDCTLTGLKSGEVTIWKNKTPRVTIKTISGNEYTNRHIKQPFLSKVKVSPHQPLCLATGGCENDLCIWDIDNPTKPIFKARNVKFDDLQLRVPIWITDLTYMNRSSDLVALCSRHSHVRLYDTKGCRRPVLSFQYEDRPLTAIATVPQQERQVVVGTASGKMALFDLRNSKNLVRTYKGIVGGIKDIVVAENLPYIFSVSLDRYLRIHNLETKRYVSRTYLKSKLTCCLVIKDLRKSDFETEEINIKRTVKKRDEIKQEEIKLEPFDVPYKKIKMLHELLLSLSGYSSCFLSDNVIINIFIKDKNQDNDEKMDEVTNAMLKKLLGNSSYFHVSEETIVKELLRIAVLNKRLHLFKSHYSLLQSLTNVQDDSENQKDALQRGHYLAALGSAIYEETKSYQIKIVQLEERILEDPSIPLSILLLELQPFQSKLTEVCKLITGYGIYLKTMELLLMINNIPTLSQRLSITDEEASLSSSVDPIIVALSRVEENKIHGCKILEFVHNRVISTVGDNHKVLQRIEKSVSKVFFQQLSYWMLYGELLDLNDEFFIHLEDEVPVKSVASDEVGQFDGRNKTIVKKAVLNPDLLPSFIDFSTAEDILFTGESIKFYEKDHNYDCGSLNRTGLVLKDKEKEFIERFTSLIYKQEFSVKELINLIETIRLCVSESLYSLVIESGLIEELHDAKSIFLLGRGELFQALFTLTKDVESSSPFFSLILDGSLKKAGRQVLLDDKLLDKFTLVHRNEPASGETGNIWKDSIIIYNVERPFDQIFNSKVQEDYNTIFKFLLSIRLAQFRLEQLWINMKGNQQKDQKENLGSSFWVIRHQMSSFIYNLQYYIKVNVLESCFSTLLTEISSYHEYQKIERAHKIFLSSVANGCFLSHPLLSASIEGIVSKIHFFCDMFTVSSPSEDSLKALKEDFERFTVKVYWALSVQGQNKCSPFISQLATRIDYNYFYSSKSSSLE